MHKSISLTLLAALFLGSCAPAQTTSTQPPFGQTQPAPATATQTIIPSEALPSTNTATTALLPETKEHLLITRDGIHLIMLNADGSLYKTIIMPDNETFGRTDYAVSPDGKWLAYETGSIQAPNSLSLNLLNLDNETSLVVANLISSDFPNNLGPIVETMSQYDESLYGDDCKSYACRVDLVQGELLSSVGAFDWSPDGKFLAFAAQIDGPSTDIYVYSVQEKIVRRLTDDLQNVESMEWSPDGKRLLYTKDIPGIYYGRRTFHVTDLEGKTLQLSQKILTNDSQWSMHGWISNTLYLLQALYPEPGQRHFRQLVVVNTEAGQLREIWPYHADEVVIDASNQTIILSFSLYSFDNPIPNAPETGTYMISINGEREKVNDRTFSQINSSSQIIGIDGDGNERKAYHILSDGSIQQIGTADWGLANSSSPNQKWFFLDEGYEDGYNRFSLYNDAYQQTKSWTLNEDIRDASWRPDSLGIFVFTSDNIYYLATPDGEPQLLNVEVPTCQWDPVVCTFFEFSWRP